MLIDIIYDLAKFGSIMHEKRIKGNLTQKKIRDHVGINPETIRNIEYGLQLPTIDTLSKLSEVYNMDIVKVLEKCKFEKDDFLNSIKHRIDKCTYDEDLENIDNLSIQLEEYLRVSKEKLPVFFIKKVEQLKLLSELITLKNKTDSLNINQSIEKCLNAININHKDFNINKIIDVFFDLLELRILTLLSFQYLRLHKNKLALEIVDIVIINLDDHIKSNVDAYPLLINAHFMKSYEHFIIGEHDQVIKSCEDGIKLSKERYFVRFLPSLYFRKGISEYKLKDAKYNSTLNLCFNTLEIIGDTQTRDDYKSVLHNRYAIEIVDNRQL